MSGTKSSRLPATKTFFARFFSKIRVSETSFYNGTPCWEWTAYRNQAGYGCVSYGGKSREAYRISYEVFVGKLEKSYVPDHLCRNRACVSPIHLDAVTQRENVLRGNCASSVNARKTHCIRGHLLSGENLFIHSTRGYRQCLTCSRDKAKQRCRDLRGGGLVGNYNARKTHCPKGHEFTPENTGKQKTNGRYCRACLRQQDRDRKKAEHCRQHGHEYNEANFYTPPNGSRRQCRLCIAHRVGLGEWPHRKDSVVAA